MRFAIESYLSEVASLHDTTLDAIVAPHAARNSRRLFGADVPVLRLGVAEGL